MACLFLRSDPRLNLSGEKISGGGLTFGPPQYLYHGYAPAHIIYDCDVQQNNKLKKNNRAENETVYCEIGFLFGASHW